MPENIRVPTREPDSIEWFIEDQAISLSYDLAPPPPPPPILPSLHVCRRSSLLSVGGGGGRSQIHVIRRRYSLASMNHSILPDLNYPSFEYIAKEADLKLKTFPRFYKYSKEPVDHNDEKGGGGGAEPYNVKKAWSSVNHSILCGESHVYLLACSCCYPPPGGCL